MGSKKEPRLTSELIQQHGRQIVRIDISAARATELASEVERLNDAVLDASARIDFNDEPARFTSLLESYRKEIKR